MRTFARLFSLLILTAKTRFLSLMRGDASSLWSLMIMLVYIISPRAFRDIRVGSFNCFGRSSYDNSHRPSIRLVARRCAFLMTVISLTLCGLQAAFAYSSCDQNTLIKQRKVSLSRCVNAPLIISMVDLLY